MAKHAFDHAHVIKALVLLARPIILQKFRPDSCVASTRIAIDVLTRFGIHARPLCCRVMIENRAYIDHAQRNLGPPRSSLELEGWFKEDGSHTIGIGFPNGEAGLNVHVVCLADGHVIDLSLDQANRPDKGIKLGPLCLSVDTSKKGRWEGDDTLETWLNNCHVAYKFIEGRYYERSQNWWNPIQTATTSLAVYVAMMRFLEEVS